MGPLGLQTWPQQSSPSTCGLVVAQVLAVTTGLAKHKTRTLVVLGRWVLMVITILVPLALRMVPLIWSFALYVENCSENDAILVPLALRIGEEVCGGGNKV